MAKINYVVTCWSGTRRFMEPDYDKDRTHFLKIQLQQLQKYENSLSQITFVINHNPDEDEDYKKFIEDLPKEVNGVPLVVLRRENIGMMFGVWLHVCETYEKNFDYYFVTEDDYVPTLDNFDKIFLSQMSEKCGFMCPQIALTSIKFWLCKNYWPNFGLPMPKECVKVAIYVVGLISSEALCCLLKKYGKSLYEHGKDNYNLIDCGFIFCAFHNEGYDIDQLYGYKSNILHHKHSNDKPWGFKNYGNGPLIFSSSLKVEITNRAEEGNNEKDLLES